MPIHRWLRCSSARCTLRALLSLEKIALEAEAEAEAEAEERRGERQTRGRVQKTRAEERSPYFLLTYALGVVLLFSALRNDHNILHASALSLSPLRPRL